MLLKVEPTNSGHLNKEAELVGIAGITSADGVGCVTENDL